MTYFRNLMAMLRKPYYGNVPIFPGGQDLSWIPDAGTNITTEFPAETLDGIITTFTFTSTVKYLVWNGQLLRPPQDFTASGTQAIMPTAPSATDELYAVV